MHAREVLRSTAQRLVIQRLFGVTAYLLGTFDGKDLSDKACKPVIDSATREVAEIRKEYVTAATRSAQIVYFWGMVSGLVWLGVLGLFALPLLLGLNVATWALEAFYGCALAGALGAMVSVVARMNQSSFKVEYDVGRPTIRRLGAFRPLVGAVFGVVIYLALQSHLMHIDVGAGDQQFPFFAVGRSSRASASGSCGTRLTGSRPRSAASSTPRRRRRRSPRSGRRGGAHERRRRGA